MVGPLIFFTAVVISNCKDKRTKPITGFIALESSFMVFFWIYQTIFLLRDNHNSSPILITFALIANYIINCIFYDFLKTRILNGRDKLFAEYQKSFSATQKLIMNFSMLTSF